MKISYLQALQNANFKISCDKNLFTRKHLKAKTGEDQASNLSANRADEQRKRAHAHISSDEDDIRVGTRIQTYTNARSFEASQIGRKYLDTLERTFKVKVRRLAP